MKMQRLVCCVAIFLLSSCSSLHKSTVHELTRPDTVENNSDVDPNKKFEYGETLLHKEAYAKFQKPNLNVMKRLIQRGADVNANDDYGNTPLHVCRDLKAAELLVKYGANLGVLNNQGFNPLDAVCYEASRLSVWDYDDIDWIVDVAEFLLRQGARFSKKFKLETIECKRLLLLILKNGGAVDMIHAHKIKLHGIRNPKMIKFLCKSGLADVDGWTDIDGIFKTALHVAVEYGWLESVTTLLECGANVNTKFKSSPDKSAMDIEPNANQEEIRALLRSACQA